MCLLYYDGELLSAARMVKITHLGDNPVLGLSVMLDYGIQSSNKEGTLNSTAHE